MRITVLCTLRKLLRSVELKFGRKMKRFLVAQNSAFKALPSARYADTVTTAEQQHQLVLSGFAPDTLLSTQAVWQHKQTYWSMSTFEVLSASTSSQHMG